jgi:hypothetical protein
MMKETKMTIDEFNDLFETDNSLYDKYMEYIMQNANLDERLICNGDTLLEAAEAGYLFEDFYDHCMEIGLHNI